MPQRFKDENAAHVLFYLSSPGKYTPNPNPAAEPKVWRASRAWYMRAKLEAMGHR